MKTEPILSDTKINILLEFVRLKNEGNENAANEVFKTYPLEPHLAKNIKAIYGKDFLLSNGYNLSEAEDAYGRDWLNKQ